jgi:hypothetical protein
VGARCSSRTGERRVLELVFFFSVRMNYGYTNSAGANDGNVTSLNSTATQIFLRPLRDVLANVIVEILEHALAAIHASPYSAGRRTRAIAFANLSHLLVSSVSCRRPFAVNR